MTLEGAQRAMRNRGKKNVSRSAELMERLQNIKSLLLEMREMLGEEESREVIIDDEASMPVVAAEAADELHGENSAVKVIEPGRSQLIEEKKRAAAEKRADERKSQLPFYEQTLF